ncbi:erythromycin biosynthesis sensory transduction protein eryC1 (plasmid) [Microvirga ossetica]|uniref:Erythromycin biosynthesis sensory transduction protein eryC1 n=1 Tax=Microvirga ossetica TaxID=1882682 RepID=A0A1B2EQD5_9HYPH|nr:DegT/DnrJ/EryC1/StrS family aminotransferase [Microvirga ossetica]ANY82185.1 erythromycin biosynthesis sensory transduction protein eryC1 [Microvirga ossetica]
MIPFLDIKAQYQTVQGPLERAVLDVLRSGDYVLGDPVRTFERDFAAYCGAGEAVALNTGTSALHLALLAAGVGPGDEVITVPLTFVATAAAIVFTGATPVFVDVDPKTFTMDPEAFEAAITPQTRAVLPVHLHGRLADMEAICAIANRHGIMIIEDAAQAHGAERDGRRAGTFGTMGCFSFYPGKNLGACGEGGAVVTSDSEIAALLRCLRDWGQQGKYNHILRGFNYRMDTLQAAVLGVKLQFLPAWTEARQRIAASYESLLVETGVERPGLCGRDHVYHVYSVCVEGRDKIREILNASGVATGIHYPRPVHMQPAYASISTTPGGFPVSERLAERFLSLPIYPEMTQQQVIDVADALSRATEGRIVEAA